MDVGDGKGGGLKGNLIEGYPPACLLVCLGCSSVTYAGGWWIGLESYSICSPFLVVITLTPSLHHLGLLLRSLILSLLPLPAPSLPGSNPSAYYSTDSTHEITHRATGQPPILSVYCSTDSTHHITHIKADTKTY